jgi:hypothetical protein
MKTDIEKLIKLTQSWASGTGFNPDTARSLRHQGILNNHKMYVQNIPAYRKLAHEEGCREEVDIDVIKKKLMSTDDVFKSYNQEWLDRCDFERMNQWLSGLFYRQIVTYVSGVESIDDWIECLKQSGISLSYSSGTSGTFSFIPRDPADWARAQMANTNYLTPLLTYRKIGSPLTRLLMKPATSLLSPNAFAAMVHKFGLPDFDGVFLGFRSGRMGNQVLMQELAPVFRRSFFLYDIDLSASALRAARRGGKNERERQLAAVLQREVIEKREENYLKIIRRIKESSRRGQKIFIFGAPYQLKDLCEIIAGAERNLSLKKGSLILFGGGWKSFSGETLNRDSLVKMISESFELPPERILEGYSMTEINVLMLRCDAGSFHVPPLIEPVVLDEELCPIEGRDLKGTFGFLDPLANSYPGFIISGDRVHLVDRDCSCGLGGPAITEIGRAKNREVKGCGGVMSSIKA